MNSYSQAGQDEWVMQMLGHPQTGFFVEVGAYDGIQTSNTYALEQAGWKGVCIEANPDVFELLRQNRASTNIHAAATDGTGSVWFAGDRIVGEGEGTKVRGGALDDLLWEVRAPRTIDYLSIDIEGGELDVLSNFDFDEFYIRLMTVEHNLYCEGPGPKDALFELLSGAGFIRVREDVKCLDPNPLYHLQPYEDWYCHESFTV